MSTATLGAGSAGAGLTPAGLGAPATATAPTDALLYDVTGPARSSRAIGTSDVTRGQYVLDTAGNVTGMGDVRQLVALAFMTDVGSAADETVGNRIVRLRTLGDDAASQIATLARETVADLVKRGLVRLDSVDVALDRPHGAAGVTVHLTDLTTGEPIRQVL